MRAAARRFTTMEGIDARRRRTRRRPHRLHSQCPPAGPGPPQTRAREHEGAGRPHSVCREPSGSRGRGRMGPGAAAGPSSPPSSRCFIWRSPARRELHCSAKEPLFVALAPNQRRRRPRSHSTAIAREASPSVRTSPRR
jgi:hypothetical protein